MLGFDRSMADVRGRCHALVLLALGAISACAPDGAGLAREATDSAREALTNAEVDEGHPAVVTFRAQGFTFCTGTVIAPRVILTAGHCVSEEVTGVTPEEIEVFFGTDPGDGEGTFIPVVEGAHHPEWTTEDLYNGFDVGLLRLAEDAPVAAMPIGAGPAVDDEVTLVGFGNTSNAGGGGVKHVGGAVVTEVTDALFDIAEEPSALCIGDSGGPALLEIDGVETIVGVGSLGSCGGRSVEQRVDLHVESFIAPWAATCEADGFCAATCDAPDPDCPCASDGHCTDACADPAGDVDCPACVADGVCDAACAEGAAGADPDCATGASSSDASATSSGAGSGGGTGGEGDGAAEGGDDEGGCSVGSVTNGVGPGGAAGTWAAAAALLLGRARRRRAAPVA